MDSEYLPSFEELELCRKLEMTEDEIRQFVFALKDRSLPFLQYCYEQQQRYGIENLEDMMEDDYKCGKCGKTNCKLWRLYSTCPPPLYCRSCGLQDQNKRDEECTGDDIGWLVGAIPMKGGYWGKTSSPPRYVRWWRELPV